jgi:hypothetical protein
MESDLGVTQNLEKLAIVHGMDQARYHIGVIEACLPGAENSDQS